MAARMQPIPSAQFRADTPTWASPLQALPTGVQRGQPSGAVTACKKHPSCIQGSPSTLNERSSDFKVVFQAGTWVPGWGCPNQGPTFYNSYLRVSSSSLSRDPHNKGGTWISLHDNFSRTCQVLGTWAAESDRSAPHLEKLASSWVPRRRTQSQVAQRLAEGSEPIPEHVSSVSHPNPSTVLHVLEAPGR